MSKFNVIKTVERICEKYNIKCEDTKHDLVVVALENTASLNTNEEKIQVAYDSVIDYISKLKAKRRREPRTVQLRFCQTIEKDVLETIIEKEYLSEICILHSMFPEKTLDELTEMLVINLAN